MLGAASPERLTFFVNRVFIEMNSLLEGPITILQPAIHGITKKDLILPK